MTHEALMRLALEEAEAAFREGEVPVGAVLVADGRIIACAGNRTLRNGDPTAHAEMLVLREGARVMKNHRLAETTLYVTLEPCPMCAGAISQARLGKLVFGAFDEERGCAGSLYRICEDPAFPWFPPSVGGVLEAECKALLDVLFQRARR